MSLQPVPIKLRLLSPMHIGYLPNRAGTVIARTRYYIPGKTLWGALTAALTPRLFSHERHLKATHFQKVGSDLKQALHFSYFYIWDGKNLYTPKYSNEGLTWGNIPETEFEWAFIASRVSTAIDPSKGSARDRSLHEIQHIKHAISRSAVARPVFVAGYIWLTQLSSVGPGALQVHEGRIVVDCDQRDIFLGVALGGERNYGFGRVVSEKPDDTLKEVLGRTFGPDAKSAGVTLRGHCKYDPRVQFRGDVELLSGRTYDLTAPNEAFHGPGRMCEMLGPFFTPGTVLLDNPGELERDYWGMLAIKKNRTPD